MLDPFRGPAPGRKKGLLKKHFLGQAVVALTLLAVAFAWTSTLAQAAPFVYVTNIESGTVSQYDATGGALAPLSPSTISAAHPRPLDVAVTPDGKAAYVTTSDLGTPAGGAALEEYSIGPSGALTLRSFAPLPSVTDPGDMAVSPDGRSLYVINGDSRVIQYTVGADGDLTLKSPPTVAGVLGATRLAISPDGRNLYVTEGATGVAQFTVGGDGTLSPKSPPSVPVEGDPYLELAGVAVSPDSTSAYVVDTDAGSGLPGTVLQYTVGADGTRVRSRPSSCQRGRTPSRWR